MALALPASSAEHPTAAAARIGDEVRRLFDEALSSHQAGRLSEAADRYREIIARDPNLPEVHSNLGTALADLGRLEEAEASYRRAIALQPDFATAHNNLGNVLKHQGRLADAALAYRRAVTLLPDFAGAYSNLGAVLADLGRLRDAELVYRYAISLQPDNAPVHSNLGNALRDMDRLDEAEAAYRKAIALKSDYTTAYCNLGVTLKRCGRLAEAEAALRQAIALKPDLIEAHSNLGNVLRDLGRLGEAEQCYRAAIARRPDYADGFLNLGVVLKEQSRPEDAEVALRRALALRPDAPEALSNLGNTLTDLGRYGEAKVHLRRAIALRPDFAAAHNNLAVLLKECGEIAEACVAAEEALRLAPRCPMYYRNLGEVRSFKAGEPIMTALEELAQNMTSLTMTERIDLHFALAKAYDDIGDSDKACDWLFAGNALKRQQVVYDEAVLLGALPRIRTAFTPELIRDRRDAGDPSQLPVFIFGMMRSGTTLVEQILASHPQVHGGGELKLFYKTAARALTTAGGARDYPDAVPHLSDDALRRLGAAYVADVAALSPAATHITDKMPSNYFFAGLIHLALPNAILIHVTRDPVDTCMSCFAKLFTEEQNYTYDLGELGRYYRNYQAVMAHWHSVLPPGRILDVRYEDVVADLAGAAQRIIAHCGLDWDPRCLAFHETRRAVRTASAMQVRQPLYTTSVGRWHAYARCVEPLIAALGPQGTSG